MSCQADPSPAQEIARVLKVGGSVEIFEEGEHRSLLTCQCRSLPLHAIDIIFPVLPRSSTATPRQRQRKRSTILRSPQKSRGSSSVTKHLSPALLPAHDHAVLETLFYRVFERRFINLQPTALLMGTLNIYLRHAAGSPLINVPLPPSPPPHQDPPVLVESDSRSATPRMPQRGDSEDSRSSTPVPEKRDADEDGQTSSTASSSCCSTVYSAKSTPATSVAELEDPADGPVAFYSDAGLASVSSTKGKEPFSIMPEERLMVTAGTLGLNFRRRCAEMFHAEV
jgi:hypothetical protein